jgi:hypothetical protein
VERNTRNAAAGDGRIAGETHFSTTTHQTRGCSFNSDGALQPKLREMALAQMGFLVVWLFRTRRDCVTRRNLKKPSLAQGERNTKNRNYTKRISETIRQDEQEAPDKQILLILSSCQEIIPAVVSFVALLIHQRLSASISGSSSFLFRAS